MTTINLAQLACSTHPNLAPARRWATSAAIGHLTNRLVSLDATTLGHLATLCDLTPAELLDALRELHSDRKRVAEP